MKYLIYICIYILLQQKVHAAKILDKILSYDVIVVIKSSVNEPKIEEIIKGNVTEKVKGEIVRLSKFYRKRRILLLFGVNGSNSSAFYTIDSFEMVCSFDDVKNKEDCISLGKIRESIK